MEDNNERETVPPLHENIFCFKLPLLLILLLPVLLLLEHLLIEKRPIKACNRSRSGSIDKFPLLPRTRSIGEEFTIGSRSLSLTSNKPNDGLSAAYFGDFSGDKKK